MHRQIVTFAIAVLLSGAFTAAGSEDVEPDYFTRNGEDVGRYMNWSIYHQRMHSKSIYRCRAACVWGSPSGRLCAAACAPSVYDDREGISFHFNPGYFVGGDLLFSHRLFVRVDGDLPVAVKLNQSGSGGTMVSRNYGKKGLVDRIRNGRKLYLHIGTRAPKKYDFVFLLPGVDDAFEWISNVEEDVSK